MSKRIYFDTETTGLYPRIGEGDEVIAISIVDGDGKVLHDAIYRPRWNETWPEAEALEKQIAILENLMIRESKVSARDGYMVSVALKPGVHAGFVTRDSSYYPAPADAVPTSCVFDKEQEAREAAVIYLSGSGADGLTLIRPDGGEETIN